MLKVSFLLNELCMLQQCSTVLVFNKLMSDAFQKLLFRDSRSYGVFYLCYSL